MRTFTRHWRRGRAAPPLGPFMACMMAAALLLAAGAGAPRPVQAQDEPAGPSSNAVFIDQVGPNRVDQAISGSDNLSATAQGDLSFVRSLESVSFVPDFQKVEDIKEKLDGRDKDFVDAVSVGLNPDLIQPGNSKNNQLTQTIDGDENVVAVRQGLNGGKATGNVATQTLVGDRMFAFIRQGTFGSVSSTVSKNNTAEQSASGPGDHFLSIVQGSGVAFEEDAGFPTRSTGNTATQTVGGTGKHTAAIEQGTDGAESRNNTAEQTVSGGINPNPDDPENPVSNTAVIEQGKGLGSVSSGNIARQTLSGAGNEARIRQGVGKQVGAFNHFAKQTISGTGNFAIIEQSGTGGVVRQTIEAQQGNPLPPGLLE